jgi:hypothetical protein
MMALERTPMSGWLETLEGAGKILRDGVEIGEVAYSIKVFEAKPRGELYPYAKFRRRGYLDLYDILDKPVTLVLSDGRQWGCLLKSLDGTVVPTTPWPRNQGET